VAMADRTRRVVFGRINRRNPNQETFDERTFAEDIEALADSHLTVYTERSTGGRPGKHWIAADMTVTPSDDFLTGVLGFTEQQQQLTFDTETFSWMKAEVEDSDAASEATVAPFAVDLREENRWVAFATTSRLQPQSSRKGLEHVLNHAVAALGLMPTAWEVDLVTSSGVIREWLERNPLVRLLRRTLKFTNPGRDLDDVRQQMRNLAANRKTEEFAAPRGKILNVDSEEFQGKLEGTETGDVDLVMESRGFHGVGRVTFNSRDTVDTVEVEDYGTNLQRGIDIVLAALREYVASMGGPEQPELA
jgi:hypothetical protein